MYTVWDDIEKEAEKLHGKAEYRIHNARGYRFFGRGNLDKLTKTVKEFEETARSLGLEAVIHTDSGVAGQLVIVRMR